MEETMSELLDRSNDTLKDDLNGGLNGMQNTGNTSHLGDEPRSYPFDKKAKIMPTPTPPLKGSSDEKGMEVSGWSSSSSIYSGCSKSAKILQSSPSRRSEARSSNRDQATFSSNERSARTAQNTSDHEVSDRRSQSPPALRAFHAKYRNSGSSLMTLHMFTNRMRGTRPVYVPVYKRNSLGMLLKLKKNRHGRWRYIEWEHLEEDEIDRGLKVLENPEAEVVSQS